MSQRSKQLAANYRKQLLASFEGTMSQQVTSTLSTQQASAASARRQMHPEPPLSASEANMLRQHLMKSTKNQAKYDEEEDDEEDEEDDEGEEEETEGEEVEETKPETQPAVRDSPMSPPPENLRSGDCAITTATNLHPNQPTPNTHPNQKYANLNYGLNTNQHDNLLRQQFSSAYYWPRSEINIPGISSGPPPQKRYKLVTCSGLFVNSSE